MRREISYDVDTSGTFIGTHPSKYCRTDCPFRKPEDLDRQIIIEWHVGEPQSYEGGIYTGPATVVRCGKAGEMDDITPKRGEGGY